MLMLMSWLSSLAHKLLMLMFMLMLASLVSTGLKTMIGNVQYVHIFTTMSPFKPNKAYFFTTCPFSNNIVYVYALCMSEDFTIAVY